MKNVINSRNDKSVLSIFRRLSVTLPAFAAECRRLQLEIDVCCIRRFSAANPPAAVAVFSINKILFAGLLSELCNVLLCNYKVY